MDTPARPLSPPFPATPAPSAAVTYEPATQSSPQPARSRIASLDFIRGACLMVIAFDHISSFFRKLGYQGRELLTPTMLGYSSAAELFLFVSGALVGIIQSRPELAARQRLIRLSHRAGHLYLYNALAFVGLLAACTLLSTQAIDALGLTSLVQAPFKGARDFLTMSSSPPLLDILTLYVAFLLVAIGFIPLARRAPALAMGLSFLLYAACQWPVAQEKLGLLAIGRGLNPWAWQLCFMVGLICGQYGILKRMQEWLAQPKVTVLLVVALVLTTAVFIADRKLGLSPESWWEKHDLGPIRLPHAALVFSAYVCLSSWPLDARLPAAAHRIHEAIALMGCHSLEVFMAGIALTYAVSPLVGQHNLSTTAYYATLAFSAAAMWCLARYLAWRARARQPVTSPP